MPYSAAGDVMAMVGNTPLPRAISTAGFVQDAADEIDSMIGFIYQTPIDITTGSAVVRPAQLLLKRLNNHLATGRLIMAVASPAQEDNLHAYGASLVQGVMETLRAIAAGDVLLEGAPRLPGADLLAPGEESGPIINNIDKESNVEAFYDRVVNPAYGPFYDAEHWRRRYSPEGYTW